MSDELKPRETASDVKPDELRQPDRDVEGDVNPPPAPLIIPGNVGSLDDVPADVLEEGEPTGDDVGR